MPVDNDSKFLGVFLLFYLLNSKAILFIGCQHTIKLKINHILLLSTVC